MNRIDASSFHDASFNGILVEQNKAELSFQLSTGISVKLILEKLNRLVCSNFREGNIVLEVAMSSSLPVCEPWLEALFPKPAGMFDKYYEFINLTKNRLLDNELVILYVAPSYGGELFALCEKIKTVKSSGF